MKRSSFIVFLGLFAASAASAAVYQVQGGNSCERWVSTPYGAYPVILGCQVYGIYEAASCDDAYSKLQAETCCGGDRKLTFNKAKCEVVQ